jgi:hypothetical protein
MHDAANAEKGPEMNTSSVRTVMLALVHVPPSVDENEFNNWYNEEHAAERMQCPGFISVARFRATDNSRRYLALYELAGAGAIHTPEYGSLIRIPSDIGRPGVSGSALTERIIRSLNISARGVFEEVYRAPGHFPELKA